MAVKVVEVHPGIYEIFLPLPMRPTIVNVYLVDCGGAWALVDTGMNSAESLAALEEAFAQVGARLDALDVLIATHHHPDHFGASARIQKRSHASVYLHERELERVRRTLEFARRSPAEQAEGRAFFLSHGFPIDRYPAEGMRPAWLGSGLYQPTLTPDEFIADGEIVQVGKRSFEVVWTPGHSPGHCVLYLARERVMIVGDHLLPRITPHVGLYPGSATNPLRDFLDSQVKVQRFEVAMVLPAHGAVFHDHRHRANQLIEHHRYRESEMLDIIRSRPLTAFEVAEQVFGRGDRSVFHVMAATFETLAHLEYAYSEGRARRIEQNGRTLYQAV